MSNGLMTVRYRRSEDGSLWLNVDDALRELRGYEPSPAQAWLVQWLERVQANAEEHEPT